MSFLSAFTNSFSICSSNLQSELSADVFWAMSSQGNVIVALVSREIEAASACFTKSEWLKSTEVPEMSTDVGLREVAPAA